MESVGCALSCITKPQAKRLLEITQATWEYFVPLMNEAGEVSTLADVRGLGRVLMVPIGAGLHFLKRHFLVSFFDNDDEVGGISASSELVALAT